MVSAMRAQLSALVLGIAMGVLALVLLFGCSAEPSVSTSPASVPVSARPADHG